MPPKRDPPSLEETLAALNVQLIENHSKTHATLETLPTTIAKVISENQSKTQNTLETLPTTIATAIAESMNQLQNHITQFMQTPSFPKHMAPQPYVDHPSSSSNHHDPNTYQLRQRPQDTPQNPAAIKPPRINLAMFDGSITPPPPPPPTQPSVNHLSPSSVTFDTTSYQARPPRLPTPLPNLTAKLHLAKPISPPPTEPHPFVEHPSPSSIPPPEPYQYQAAIKPLIITSADDNSHIDDESIETIILAPSFRTWTTLAALPSHLSPYGSSASLFAPASDPSPNEPPPEPPDDDNDASAPSADPAPDPAPDPSFSVPMPIWFLFFISGLHTS